MINYTLNNFFDSELCERILKTSMDMGVKEYHLTDLKFFMGLNQSVKELDVLLMFG
jgi:hypothetical protein